MPARSNGLQTLMQVSILALSGYLRESYGKRRRRQATWVSSRSRRFKANNSEYKWKIAENGSDLFVCGFILLQPADRLTLEQCVNARGKTIATWSQEGQILRVSRSAEGFLDRVVVTCFLNLWMKQLNLW
ncbi:hypothetical protein AcW1_004503 [Taiwanofungus camphoratus]|nr:hypothetical protein AcW2_006493 [Antrodia cinnamomea]KAI0939472.1 hypothetical protein AcV5_000884 [Antrodia cinnamomea]KAI0952394.1 hypothetical protein AcV7_008217 [Antrodia cinnamomea]KAI0959774.1 hypothetical protein AcW1_004503 [Antrodia cinnamomea]